MRCTGDVSTPSISQLFKTWFECLKSINSVFGTTYEKVDDLFPELAKTEQQTTTDASSTAPSGEESATAAADEDDEEEDDEDFVCNEEEDDDEEDHEASGNAIKERKPTAKAQLEPPAQGRYSRWRIDYRDGTSELLTRSKTQAGINRAAVQDSSRTLIFDRLRLVHEEDETFEVKEGSEEEPDEEEDNDEDGEEGNEGEEEPVENVSDQASPTTVTASHDE
ncbi:hypothetical protein PHPALM_5624, partial [Phytophthora palmivora]